MRKKQTRHISIWVDALQKTAWFTLPFYQKIAKEDVYARRWSQAVRQADLDQMNRFIRRTIPASEDHSYALAANGIGYFIDLSVPSPMDVYTNSVTIPPGLTRFYFRARSLQTIAQAIQPLCESIAANQSFSYAIVKAIMRQDDRTLERLIREQVASPYLMKTTRAPYGFATRFEFPFDPYPYDYAFFRDVP